MGGDEQYSQFLEKFTLETFWEKPQLGSLCHLSVESLQDFLQTSPLSKAPEPFERICSGDPFVLFGLEIK